MHDFAVRFATAASLAACSVVVLAAPVSAVDATGVRIERAAPAARIVSLAPHATELLFAAGAGGSVVGLLAPADWPPEAKRVPRVGDAAGLDLERVVALKPDLVVVWPYFAPGEVERLRALGVPVFVSDPRTPEAIADDLEGLGALAGTSETAARAATDFRTRLAALLQRSRAAAKLVSAARTSIETSEARWGRSRVVARGERPQERLTETRACDRSETRRFR